MNGTAPRGPTTGAAGGRARASSGAGDAERTARAFAEAFNRHDLEALAALITEDCVFEDTSPPGGGCHHGSAAVLEAWRAFFASAPGAVFTTEEMIAGGDRATVLWDYTWDGGGHVRGVDVLHIRAGRVARKLAYVKG